MGGLFNSGKCKENLLSFVSYPVLPLSGKGGSLLKMYSSLFTLMLKLSTGFLKFFPLLLYTISSVDKLKLAIGLTLLLTYFACKSAAEINLAQ